MTLDEAYSALVETLPETERDRVYVQIRRNRDGRFVQAACGQLHHAARS